MITGRTMVPPKPGTAIVAPTGGSGTAPPRTPKPGGALSPGEEPNQGGGLSTLPKEWRPAVSYFYGFYSEVLKGSLCISIRFQYWMKKDGLTLDEAKQVMGRLMEPEFAGNAEFGSQKLLAMMAQETAKVITVRKKHEAALALRKQAEESLAHADRLAVSEMIKGLAMDSGMDD